ncbi:MAG: MBL fold metallo-hydrolase, partial [Spirochaetia bacterium]|nr:MBL fold metallo-hydrolase [Spirochaetia bacterium]
HGDHLDKKALSYIQDKGTKLILTSICANSLSGGMVMYNGDKMSFEEISIEAVPAYNIAHKRESGEPFHVKGEGNGYILIFGDKKIYIAGDTENIPEMKNIKDIYCAFLPMNLPYTMTPEMAAEAARTLKPAILYPYHFGETDTSKLVKLLADDKGIDVRIRKMK